MTSQQQVLLADQRVNPNFISVEGLVMADDALRPSTTIAFKKHWNDYMFDFPNIHLSAAPPMFSEEPVPSSTRSDIKNELFKQRYFPAKM